MKKKETNQRAGRASPSQRVHIEFHDEQAHEVCIAGTFNEWRPNVTPMLALGGGRWVKELSLPPGRYQYQFVASRCGGGRTSVQSVRRFQLGVGGARES